MFSKDEFSIKKASSIPDTNFFVVKVFNRSEQDFFIHFKTLEEAKASCLSGEGYLYSCPS